MISLVVFSFFSLFQEDLNFKCNLFLPNRDSSTPSPSCLRPHLLPISAVTMTISLSHDKVSCCFTILIIYWSWALKSRKQQERNGNTYVSKFLLFIIMGHIRISPLKWVTGSASKQQKYYIEFFDFVFSIY